VIQPHTVTDDLHRVTVPLVQRQQRGVHEPSLTHPSQATGHPARQPDSAVLGDLLRETGHPATDDAGSAAVTQMLERRCIDSWKCRSLPSPRSPPEGDEVQVRIGSTLVGVLEDAGTSTYAPVLDVPATQAGSSSSAERHPGSHVKLYLPDPAVHRGTPTDTAHAPSARARAG
jgi:hypothetical protein